MDYDTDEGIHHLGDLQLQSGAILREARLAWKTYGTLSPERDNVVLYPTSYSATHHDQEWLIGPDGILDPTRWFVITPDMFGNGLSSSPSNQAEYPPLITVADNVHAQARLLGERFGIRRIACAYGFSMGAQQAYHWAALYPDQVERAVVVCGSARTSVHNQVFLCGLLATLKAAPEYLGRGRFSAQPMAAVRAFAHIYAGWAMSQDWYRAGLHLQEASDLEDFLDRVWAPGFTGCHAADLYAQALTWQAADISDNALYEGDLDRALRAIQARVLLMPGTTDLYFRVADNAAEMDGLHHAELQPIPSIWGHRAGSPSRNADDEVFVRDEVRRWLDV